MVDLSPGAISRKARTKGGIVTIVTVLSLVAAIGVTWLGLSVNDHVAANYDAESWLWSTTKGELARVNGLTGKVDTRQAVPNAKGHPVQLSQADRYLILRDISTGKVSAFDPATLAITSNMDTQQGLGITIALHNDSAFVVDAAQGVVRQLDPATLQPIGEALRFPPGLAGGFFDGRGQLWVAVPSEGTVTQITPAKVSTGKGGQGGEAPSPAKVRTEPVAQPFHDLAVSALDDGVAVLDQTNGKLVTVRGDVVTTITTDAAGGELPDRSTGVDVPVTVIEGRQVFVISGGEGNKAKISEFRVPGEGKLQPAIAWAGRIYVADDTNGKVYALDRNGKLVATISLVPGALQLEVRENHLFINSPGSSVAHVVNDKHEDKTVDKFVSEILGAEPPVVPPPPDPKPTISKPGAPKNIKAAAGDNQVTLTWAKAPDNGSKIIRYIVTGADQTVEVGANQRSLVITGLINGTEYVFAVKAVNGIGTGPEGKSNKVIPTRDVPDPPTDVKAEAKPNGTVEVTWAAANGQGRKITQYQVTASSAGAKTQVGATSGELKLVVPDKELEYGKQFSFTVVTINDLGATSKTSTPASNSVVPYNKPSAVKNLRGATLQTAPGAVRATWGAADENGRPITEYEITAKSPTVTKNVTATGTTSDITGFADGETVTIDVIPVNVAGKGPKATTSAKAVAQPTLTGVTNNAPGYNNLIVKWAYNDGGGSATCQIVVSGAGINVPCSSGAGGYNVGGLWPGNGYNYYVSITNAAGAAQSGTAGFNTPALNGTVTCINTNAHGDPTYCNDGIGVYRNSRQQSGEAAGDAFNGQGYQVFCKKQGTAGNQSGDATLSAVAYNNYKQSAMWIQIDFRGARRYIPWIWINLAAGDNYGMLPDC